MAFQRPKLTDIIQRVKADFNLRLSGTNETLKFTLGNVLSYVIAGASHLLHAHLDFIAKMTLPSSAENEYLEIHGDIWGVARKTVSFAYGSVKFTGSDGFGVATGTLIKGGNGIEYSTEESGIISGGELILPVVANTPGAIGNLENTEVLNLVNPIAGVASEVSIEIEGITEGTDTESDSAYKQRILDRVRNPISGGTVADYKRWTLEVPGVTRAWIFPLNTGPGTVGVTFVQDDNPDIIPVNQKILEVRTYIEERRPITAEVDVFAPLAVEVNFNIVCIPDTVEVRTAIENELKDLILREAAPGTPIPLTHIREAISVAAGENDHTLNSPTEDLTYDSNEIPVFGAVTWP